MPRTGAVPEDWDIQSSTTKKVALHGPPIVQTYASSSRPGKRGRGGGRGGPPTGPRGGRGGGSGRGGRGGASYSEPGSSANSVAVGSSSTSSHGSTYRPEPDRSFGGRGRGEWRANFREHDSWRPPPAPRADRVYVVDEPPRKPRSYSPSLPVGIGVDKSAPSSSIRPYSSTKLPVINTARSQPPINPSSPSVPRYPESSSSTRPSWATNPAPTPAPPTAPSQSATPAAVSHLDSAKRQPGVASSIASTSSIISFKPEEVASKLKFKPFNPNAPAKKHKEKGKEKEKEGEKDQPKEGVTKRSRESAKVLLHIEEEDEINDVKPVLEDLDEEMAINNGPQTSGVYACSLAEIPPPCFSKNKAERDLARTSFRKKRFKLLRSQGKLPGTVIWRDDGVAINWTLLPATQTQAPTAAISTPNKEKATPSTPGGSTERPKKKSKKEHPPAPPAPADAAKPSSLVRAISMLPAAPTTGLAPSLSTTALASATVPVPSKTKASNTKVRHDRLEQQQPVQPIRSAQPVPPARQDRPAAPTRHHLPTPPRTHTPPPSDAPPPPSTASLVRSDKLQNLEQTMAKRINAIDNWTKLLRQYPSQSEKLNHQVDRMQEEIFGLQEQIIEERERLEAEREE